MVKCGKCGKVLGAEYFSAASLVACPSCGSDTLIQVFPALFKEPDVKSLEDSFIFEHDASCFYHPQKKAVIPCSQCGRFICKVCDIELNGQHICPACLETGRKKKKIKNLENHRMLYDQLALVLALLPMFIFYFTIITAPLAIFVAIRYWKAPTSILPRTRIRSILAIIIAGLQIAGWTALIVNLVT